jgi:glycerophosphoryl diester phosphodiesterase
VHLPQTNRPASFFEDQLQPIAISHSGFEPKNQRDGSPDAFVAAVDAGFRCIQVDVVTATPSAKLVSRHAVFGRVRRFERLSESELKALGYPTLDDLFADQRFVDVWWNIETKSMKTLPALRSLLAHLEQTGRIDRFCISAPFHSRLLRRLRVEFPALATNASLLEGALVGYRLTPRPPLRVEGIQLFYPVARFRAITDRQARKGRLVQVYVVNRADTAAQFLASKVGAIITDDAAVVDLILQQ